MTIGDAGQPQSWDHYSPRETILLERMPSSKKLGILSRARGSQLLKENIASSSSPPPPLLLEWEVEIVKKDNILVRVEVSTTSVPGEYDKNKNMKIITIEGKMPGIHHGRSADRREGEAVSLQHDKKRVVPAIDKSRVSSHGIRDILLNPNITKVNHYSFRLPYSSVRYSLPYTSVWFSDVCQA